ncbi:MAG: tetrapyrrole methylase, partial [Lysobacteraceae bacterium]
MFRSAAIALLSLAVACAPAAVAQSPADAMAREAQVKEIERLAVTAPWRQSDARIDALGPQRAALTLLQRHRVDFVRLRNRALAGDQPAALKGLAELLKQDLPVPLRVRVYT